MLHVGQCLCCGWNSRRASIDWRCSLRHRGALSAPLQHAEGASATKQRSYLPPARPEGVWGCDCVWESGAGLVILEKPWPHHLCRQRGRHRSQARAAELEPVCAHQACSEEAAGEAGWRWSDPSNSTEVGSEASSPLPRGDLTVQFILRAAEEEIAKDDSTERHPGEMASSGSPH